MFESTDISSIRDRLKELVNDAQSLIYELYIGMTNFNIFFQIDYLRKLASALKGKRMSLQHVKDICCEFKKLERIEVFVNRDCDLGHISKEEVDTCPIGLNKLLEKCAAVKNSLNYMRILNQLLP